MTEQIEHVNKEFFCAVCLDWFNCSRVAFHMKEYHNRPDVNNLKSDQREWTFERLQEHYIMLGGLDIRDVPKKTEKQMKEERFFNVR